MNTPAKVLILDDEERIRQLLLDYLEDFDDFALRAEESGEDALESLAQESADLCIVDMRLPGMNGQSFILNAWERRLCGSFLLHTGSMDFTLTKELRDCGLTEADVFFKPCDMDLMLERIRSLLHLPGAEA
ncbi:MAG: response regulator [Desulfovibrio sp.]|jgi:two-component system response regulator ResD